jgi:N-acetylglucosaminyldiphosphoundecaprenol N-acetyl-beta-D-mannosaminyltransferase
MIRQGKRNVLGILVDAVDYEVVVHDVIDAAQTRKALAVTALAVHGVITGVLDAEQKYRLNQFDLILPDGQPVRWALNWLYRAGLRDRVYGPDLTFMLCRAAQEKNLPVYFYGSTQEILDSLKRRLLEGFPDLQICGMTPSKFRRTSQSEKREVVATIKESGAALAFVGLGCPRQEVWAYEYNRELSIPVISVGAAFAFHAGILAQAPPWMQKRGLEWLFRLACEPRRLWRRYLLLNPLYLSLLVMQSSGMDFATTGIPPTQDLLYG